MPIQSEETEDFKDKYKVMKRKFKLLIYENERYKQSLREANKSLLRVRQDNSFLLDTLAAQRGATLSSDSDLTDTSDTEAPKRRRVDDGTRNPPSIRGRGALRKTASLPCRTIKEEPPLPLPSPPPPLLLPSSSHEMTQLLTLPQQLFAGESGDATERRPLP